MRHYIGQARNDIAVYVDLIQSDAAKHISRKPHLLGLVSEAIQHLTLKGEQVTLECDMHRPVGYSFVVPTSDEDKVFYARLLRDDIYTRFVKNGKPLATSYLTLRLCRSNDEYDLLDVLIGHPSPARPGEADETAESKTYWTTHAVVLDNQSLQVRTVTKDCPY